MMARRTKAAKKTAKRTKRTVARPSYKALYEKEHATARDLAGEVIDLRAERDLLKKGPEFFWRTRDGRSLMPRDMEEEHLRNTISFLQRRLVCQFGTVAYVDETFQNVEALAAMLKEAKARGLRV